MRSLLLSTIAIGMLSSALPLAAQTAPAEPRWGHRFDGRWQGGWRAPGGWAAYRQPVRGAVVPQYWNATMFQIADFARYALPAPPTGYRWHRYYDDAVLLDADGRVYDSVAGIDWGADGGEVDHAGAYRPDLFDATGRFVGERTAQVATPLRPAAAPTFAPRAEIVQPLPGRAPPVPAVAQPVPPQRPATTFAERREQVQPLPADATPAESPGAPYRYADASPVRAEPPVGIDPADAADAAGRAAPSAPGYPAYEGPPPPPGHGYAMQNVEYAGRRYDGSGAGAVRTVRDAGVLTHYFADGTVMRVTPAYVAGGYWYPPTTTTTIPVRR